jgi:hypothetical protein
MNHSIAQNRLLAVVVSVVNVVVVVAAGTAARPS